MLNFNTFSARPVELKKLEPKKPVVKKPKKSQIKKEDPNGTVPSTSQNEVDIKDVKPDVKVDVKPEEQKVEVKLPAKPLSGRDVIEIFKAGDTVSIITYRKICNALEILERWEAPAQIQFLEQFWDVSDIVDNKCTTLVTNLSRLTWHKLPLEILEKYQTLLCDIGVRQVCHTQLIYESAVRNLLPRMQQAEDGSGLVRIFSPAEEDRLFSMAHQIIAHVLKCLPVSSRSLVTVVKRCFPHYTQPVEVFTCYTRHVIQMAEYAPKMAQDLWDIVVDNMIGCDTMLSHAMEDGSSDDELAGIFSMKQIKLAEEVSEDTGKEEKKPANPGGVEQRTMKLDGSMRDVLSFLAVKHGHELPEGIDMSWLRMGDSTPEEVFSIFLSLLENRMLMSVHVRYTSFIWFYLSSLNETYTTRLLDFLWSVITRPSRAQSDAKKSHGAAAYLAAFLARAKHIRASVACTWLSKIFQWCVQYVDHFSGSQVVVGVSRHGTFYSLCQTFFIAFSFRYKELVKTGDMDELRRWGLSRMVHSQLEPLKYVSRPVALCFAAITRSLQLVYCNHVLSLDPSATRPFESMFPFDFYTLKISEQFVVPFLRRFSPLAEDVAAVSSVLESGVKKEGKEDPIGDMDFLDNDEETGMPIGAFRERSNTLSQCGAQSSMFTVYSSSPGLRHYDAPINMR